MSISVVKAKNDHLQARAHYITQDALKRRLIDRKPCQVCGISGVAKDGRQLVQAHHDDYANPFLIKWLCPKHHKEYHRVYWN